MKRRNFETGAVYRRCVGRLSTVSICRYCTVQASDGWLAGWMNCRIFLFSYANLLTPAEATSRRPRCLVTITTRVITTETLVNSAITEEKKQSEIIYLYSITSGALNFLLLDNQRRAGAGLQVQRTQSSSIGVPNILVYAGADKTQIPL